MEEETKNEETGEEEVRDEAAESAETVETEESPAEEKPLDKMTSPELKEVAKKIPGVTGVTAMKKDELLALIKKDRGIVDEEPPKAAEKKDISVSDIKKKIIDLKAAKATAQTGKNKKEVAILRRRINRLKKMTRKAG